MSTENEILPINIVVPVETLGDAHAPYQSIIYDTVWSSSNFLPTPCILSTWTSPALPLVEGIGSFYMKTGSHDLFFSTKLGGELNVSAASGTGSITGPGNSTADAIVRWSGTDGILLKNTPATIDDAGNLTAASYKIGSDTLLSAGVLGSTVLASSLTSATSMNINSGQVYAIAGTSVLSATTLGSTIINSSLTNVGALISGSIGGSFGNINIGGNTVTCGSVVSTLVAVNTISSTSYKISTDTVLSEDTLGPTITKSSLTAVSALISGSISGSFGSINIGANSVTCGDCTAEQYKIGIATVLTATTLGPTVTSSSLTSAVSMDISAGRVYAIDGNTVLSSTTLGSTVINSSLTSAMSMNINSGQVYAIAGTPVLSSTTLGAGVTSSSLTSLGTQSAGVDIAMGQTYKINNANVLSANSLGPGVTSSSLTSATSMNITLGQTYKINSIDVLSAETLGAGVTNSSLTSLGTQADGVNVAGGQTYKINNTPVLSEDTLGSNILYSSLISANSMNINPDHVYAINGTAVLSLTALGYTVTESSLNYIGIQMSGVDISTDQTYKVDGISVLSADTLGANVTSSSLTSAASMDINPGQSYAIAGVNVLSSTALGSTVRDSSLTSLGTQYSGVNIATGQTYKIDDIPILSANTLGSTVTTSSLTSAAAMNISLGQVYAINGATVLSADTLGSSVTSSSLTTAAAMNINTGQVYAIAGSTVLSADTLGNDVINSSLTSLGTQASGINVATGNTYKIDTVDVLSSTALGVSVTESSLTTVGTLVSGSIAPDFGTIITDNNICTTARIGAYSTNPQCVLDVRGPETGHTRFASFKCEAGDDDSKTLMAAIGGAVSLVPMTANNENVYLYSMTQTGIFNRVILTGSTYFTGQHCNKVNNLNIALYPSDYIGLIMSSMGKYCSVDRVNTSAFVTGINAIQITEALPVLELSTVANDKKVFGVITNHKNDNYNTDGTRSYDDGEDSFGTGHPNSFVRVNGLGEGAIWITNIAGNLENGDYITSSIIPGYGMKQSDDLYHNYTVAKITMDCNFDLSGDLYRCENYIHNGTVYQRAYVGCIYLCS